MPQQSFDSLLGQISSHNLEEAWRLFLDEYSATILQVVRHVEGDSDFVADCFQFVCERLSANSLLRLRKFRPQGPAVFSTWLRAVMRNLDSWLTRTDNASLNVATRMVASREVVYYSHYESRRRRLFPESSARFGSGVRG